MMTIGIDEVGRGCWAGPLVAGAAVLFENFTVPADAAWRLADSKQLSALQRQAAADGLQRCVGGGSVAVGLGWVDAAEVDKLGVSAAVALAMRRAYQELISTPFMTGVRTHILDVVIDGSINYLPDVAQARTLVKADALVPAVSAASIMAKVARDTWMAEAARRYIGYGFEKHVGYGTKQHAEALAQLGVCELHRRSYRPVRDVLAASSSLN